MSPSAVASRVVEPSNVTWLSFHLFYHGDLDLAARRFVIPSVRSLLRSGSIYSFFFLRFGLGGPHLRLRLLADPARALDIARAIRQHADHFFREHPAAERFTPHQIEQQNQSMLALDPHETDPKVYPNQHLVRLPFRPETDRFGGPELAPFSWELFALQSAQSLDLLAAPESLEPQQRTESVLTLLLRLAQSLARAENQLRDLVGYSQALGKRLPPLAQRGDRRFEEQPQHYLELVHHAFDKLPRDGSLEALLLAGARRLSELIRDEGAAARRQILSSHMHLMANRLGLSNVEEIYLGRLLERALGAYLESAGKHPRAGFQATPSGSGNLLDLRRRALDVWLASPVGRAEKAY